MNKTNLLLSAFILSTAFLLGCSSSESTSCTCYDAPSSGVNGTSSSDVNPPSSSSSGGTIEDQKLTRKNVTISSTESYADIDGELPVAYEKDDAKSNAAKIDLVAFCGTDCKNKSIYEPSQIDLFFDPNYIGSNIYLFEIPQDQSEIFKTATRLYQILPTYNSLGEAGYLSGYGEDEIPIEEGKVFYVVTSEKSRNFIIIKKVNAQSVDLEILELPF